MARKEIGVPLDRENLKKHNDNYEELYGVVNNFVGTITDEVYEQIIDGSKLIWKEPVDTSNDLPSDASEGDTRMARDTGKVYRFDGSNWQEIQQIDAGPVNEVDARLTSQLADKAQQADLISAKENLEQGIEAVDGRVDNLVIPISPENVNIEVTDAHHSSVKNKTFESLKKRLEEDEELLEEFKNGELQEVHTLSVPNGTKNEINLIEKKSIIRVEKHVIPSHQVHDFVEREKINTVSILKPTDSVGAGNLSTEWMTIEGLEEYKNERTIPFEVEYENHFTTGNITTQVRVILPKTVTSLVEAKDILVGKSMVYQLAVPKEVSLPSLTTNTRELLKLMSNTNGSQGEGGGVIQTINLYNNLVESDEGEAVQIEGNSSILIQVENLVRGNLKPIVSLDSVNWVDARAINRVTKNGFNYIHNAGDYLVDVSGYNYFKLPLSLPFGTGNSTVIIHELPKTYIKEKEVMASSPSPLRPEAELISSSSKARPTTVKRDGTWYGVTGNSFAKSIDYGVTWESILQVRDDRARQIKVMDDGTLLLFTMNGKVLKSNVGETEFTEKISTISPDVVWSELMSIDVFKNYVFVVEYGTKVSEDPCRRAFMSVDYGETWELIFEEEVRDNYHTHHIAYDPYDDLIWIVNGDGPENSNVVVSNDFGGTWRYVYEYGDCPNQFTSILPMSDCVLFTSDNRHDSVWRWDRERLSLEAIDKIILEPAYTIVRENPGSESIGTTGFIDHDGDGSAYFGFAQHHTSINRRAKVFATKNGYDFFPIWTAPYELESDTGFVGVTHVSGIDDDGYMAVALTGTGSDVNCLKLKKPEWTECSFV